MKVELTHEMFLIDITTIKFLQERLSARKYIRLITMNE